MSCQILAMLILTSCAQVNGDQRPLPQPRREGIIVGVGVMLGDNRQIRRITLTMAAPPGPADEDDDQRPAQPVGRLNLNGTRCQTLEPGGTRGGTRCQTLFFGTRCQTLFFVSFGTRGTRCQTLFFVSFGTRCQTLFFGTRCQTLEPGVKPCFLEPGVKPWNPVSNLVFCFFDPANGTRCQTLEPGVKPCFLFL